MSALSFYELARTSHIKRWTIINTTKEQNLAEHQYNVTVIAMRLFINDVGEEPSAMFMAAAMFHDAAEIRTGDIPTPGKDFIRRLATGADGGDVFHHINDMIMPVIPFVGGNLSEQSVVYIKLADLIEAAWWIKENGAGHHAKTVADKCWRAVEDFVHTLDMYDTANPVLMDLGLPFVNKSERLTPP
jgi:5'-deoxynucleotidase YfbR-like HD superfamily hydrolase